MKETLLIKSMDVLLINTIQHHLEEAAIASQVINKMDSAYAHLFGYIELHVSPQDRMEAIEIIKSKGLA